MILEAKNISLTKDQKEILKDVSVLFTPGHINGIIGVNGSGKSMLLKCILGLENSKGTVRLSNEPLVSDDYSYIPQDNQLEGDLTVFEVVLLGLYGELSWKVKPEQVKKVEEMLKELQLECIQGQHYDTLSGGQKQMVLLAQALIKKPRILFADEPTSALDIKNQLEYLSRVTQYSKKEGCIVILVLHDLSLVSRFATKLFVMEDGVLKLKGNQKEVIQKQVLEDVFGVYLDITDTESGFLSILPTEVKENKK